MINVKIDGDQEAREGLRMVADALGGERMANALLKVGRKIEAKAKELVPVDTGALRDSIHLENITSHSIDVVADVNVDGREYALPVEYGRKKLNRSDAQPFMWPAVQEFATGDKSWEMDVLEAAVDSAIEEAMK